MRGFLELHGDRDTSFHPGAFLEFGNSVANNWQVGMTESRNQSSHCDQHECGRWSHWRRTPAACFYGSHVDPLPSPWVGEVPVGIRQLEVCEPQWSSMREADDGFLPVPSGVDRLLHQVLEESESDDQQELGWVWPCLWWSTQNGMGWHLSLQVGWMVQHQTLWDQCHCEKEYLGSKGQQCDWVVHDCEISRSNDVACSWEMKCTWSRQAGNHVWSWYGWSQKLRRSQDETNKTKGNNNQNTNEKPREQGGTAKNLFDQLMEAYCDWEGPHDSSCAWCKAAGET